MINDARGDDSRSFASHFTSSIGATAAAAAAAAASAAAAAATICRDRAHVSRVSDRAPPRACEGERRSKR